MPTKKELRTKILSEDRKSSLLNWVDSENDCFNNISQP